MPPSTNKKITQDNAKALILTIVPKTQGTVIFNSLGGIYSNAQGREIARKGHKRRISREATLPIMSALGQKQTYAPQKAMSALPPIATSIAFFGVSPLRQKRKRCARWRGALDRLMIARA